MTDGLSGGIGPGPLFSTWRFTALLEGEDDEQANPIRLSWDTTLPDVGLGNNLVILPYLNLLAPVAAANIKHVDLSVEYDLDAAGARLEDPNSTGFPTTFWCPMDSIPVRDPRYPGSSRQDQRWRIYRLPNPRDAAQRHPFDIAAPGDPRQPVIIERALADRLAIYIRFVAVDADTTPVFRTNESFQLAVAWGGFARSF